MAWPGQAQAPVLPESECLSKAAAAPSQGFRKEFQKMLGVASLFPDQKLGSAQQSSSINLPSCLEGSEEQSEADLRRPQHAGLRERICMGRGTIRLGLAFLHPHNPESLHPSISGSLHVCFPQIPTFLHPYILYSHISASLPPHSPGRLFFSQLIQSSCHSSQMLGAAGCLAHPTALDNSAALASCF